MSDMLYRESNWVKRVGVRPAHDGQRFGVWVSVNGVGWNAVLPVHATMTRFVTYFYIALSHNVVQRAILAVRDGLAATHQEIVDFDSIVGQPSPYLGCSLWPPIEVPFNWTIDLNLGNAQWTRAGVLGWQE